MSEKNVRQKRIQVMIDKKLTDDVDGILSDLGLNPTIVMEALYHRIEAEGKVPFDLSLTDEKQADYHLGRTIESLNIPVIKDKEEAEEFLFGDENHSSSHY